MLPYTLLPSHCNAISVFLQLTPWLVGGVTLRGPIFPEFQSKSTNHCTFEFSLKLSLQWEFPFSFVGPVLDNKVYCFIFLPLCQ